MISEDEWDAMLAPPPAKRAKPGAAATASSGRSGGRAGGDDDDDDGDGSGGTALVRLPVPKHVMAEGESIDYTAPSGSVYK